MSQVDFPLFEPQKQQWRALPNSSVFAPNWLWHGCGYVILPCACISVMYIHSNVCVRSSMWQTEGLLVMSSWKDIGFTQDLVQLWQIDICGRVVDSSSSKVCQSVSVSCGSRLPCALLHFFPVSVNPTRRPICRRSATSALTRTPLCSTPPSSTRRPAQVLCP